MHLTSDFVYERLQSTEIKPIRLQRQSKVTRWKDALLEPINITQGSGFSVIVPTKENL